MIVVMNVMVFLVVFDMVDRFLHVDCLYDRRHVHADVYAVNNDNFRDIV